jgi:hypothetical protein
MVSGRLTNSLDTGAELITSVAGLVRAKATLRPLMANGDVSPPDLTLKPSHRGKYEF